MPNEQRGVIKILPILIIVAAVGIISFLLISSTLPLDGLFGILNPKPSSQAAAPTTYWGSWVGGDVYGTKPNGTDYTNVPWDQETWNLYEQHTNKKMSLTHWGEPWRAPSTPQNFNSTFDFVAANNSRNRGAIPVLDWGSRGWSNQQVASGVMDQYIRNWATSVKQNYPHPIFLRFDGEMNGTWNEWGYGPPFNNTPQSFIAMWKHVHDVVEIEMGVTNLTWVWCPNLESQETVNNPADIKNIANWYPTGKDSRGKDYVDWTCFDAYNFGSIGNPNWETWDQVAGPVYNHLLQLAPGKPIMLGETGSTEKGAPAGGSKAAWLTDQLTNLPVKYPQIKAYVYFNTNPTENGRFHDWAIETSAAAQSAFATGIANPIYATNVFGSTGAIPLGNNGKILPLDELISTPNPTPISTSSPNSMTFTPVADTYTASDAPDTALGSLSFLYTNGNASITRKAFIRFDLVSAAGRTLTSAVLRVRTTSAPNAGSTGTQNVHFVSDDSWSEQFMTANNTINPNSIVTTPMGSVTAPSALNSNYDIAINLSQVQSQLGGLFSLVIQNNGNDDLVIGSKESTTPAQLILTFNTPAAILGDITSNTGGGPDGKVDIHDFGAVVSAYGRTGSNLPEDITNNQGGGPDGKVDIHDFGAVVSNYGRSS